jgi:transcription antitermination factor NusG
MRRKAGASTVENAEISLAKPTFYPALEAYIQPRWYALYTCANHEKRVAKQLEERAVEHFLPLYDSVRRWKDRKVKLELPLFPGYVFVHLALQNRLGVLQVPGVARLVGFGGLPVALPDQQLEALRAGLKGDFCAEPHPYLVVGRRVRITRGPLQGTEGILIRKKGSFRVVLSLVLIMRSVAVEVDTADIELIPL